MAAVKAENRIAMIPVFMISPCPISRGYRRDRLVPLSRSIEKNGILQPITVRDVAPCEFELVSGERRLRAAVMAGLSVVPCIIIHCTRRQSAVYRLVENIQVSPPRWFERAEALRSLTEDLGFSCEKAAMQLGISQRSIEQHITMLRSSKHDTEQPADFSEIPDSKPMRRLVVKDIRLFYNTIERAIATMRSSGIDAHLERHESDAHIELKITIPLRSH